MSMVQLIDGAAVNWGNMANLVAVTNRSSEWRWQRMGGGRERMKVVYDKAVSTE